MLDSEVLFYIGQGLSIVAIALGFLAFQMKTQRSLIAVQTVTSTVFTVSYLLIGAMSGMAMNLVATFRNGAYAYRNSRGGGKVIPIIFVSIMAIVGILAWEAWYSVFIFFGLVVNSAAMASNDPQFIRYSILITSPVVIVYNVIVLSVGGIVYESVAIVSSIIGIIRFRNKKNANNSIQNNDLQGDCK